MRGGGGRLGREMEGEERREDGGGEEESRIKRWEGKRRERRGREERSKKI